MEFTAEQRVNCKNCSVWCISLCITQHTTVLIISPLSPQMNVIDLMQSAGEEGEF